MKKLVKTLSIATVVAMATIQLSSCATIVSGGAPKITINGNVPEPVTIETEDGAYIDVSLPTVARVTGSVLLIMSTLGRYDKEKKQFMPFVGQ